MQRIGIIWLYFSLTSCFALTIVEALSDTMDEILFGPIAFTTSKIFSDIYLAVCEWRDKSSKEYIYSFPEGKVKIKAYIDAPLVLVHPSRPELLKDISFSLSK